MVYFVKTKSQEGLVFRSEQEMISAGFKRPDKTATDEEFNSKGCYFRLIDGEFVLGRTKAEIADEEKQEEIAKYIAELDELDKQIGSGRSVRDISMRLAENSWLTEADAYKKIKAAEILADEIREKLRLLLKTA